MGRRLSALSLLAALVLVSAAATADQRIVPPAADALARDLAVLTAPGMDGRSPGTPGGALAARTIAAWLETSGLQPGGEGTFFQSFVLSRGTALAPGNRLAVPADPATELRLERDWLPHGGSRDGDIAGPLVFVGHGITRRGGDDYGGVDVRGKIVVVLDGVPEALRGQVVTRAQKLSAAQRQGAAAALFVADPLPSLEATDAVLPFVSASVTRTAVDQLLRPAGRTLAELEAEVEARGGKAVALPVRARLRVVLAREDRHAMNVIGVIPGTDPAVRHEAVVVGAHFDHVGIIDGAIHPGADDNASGTAVVVNLARAFAAGPAPRRTLVFALFDAEELGLIGSRYYVQHPAVPIEHTAAMINLDMVGRLREHLIVGGVATGQGLSELVTEAARDAGVPVRLQQGPWAPSDHLRFFRAGVPVLFFTTGIHEDYHRPTDLPDRVSVAGMARIGAVVARVTDTLLERPRPLFVDVPPPRANGASGGVLLGVVADHHAREGVRLAEVMPGSAAEQAGLRAGDLILRLDGHGINTFPALRRIVAARVPGSVVEVVYLRDGEVHVAHATLGSQGSGSR